MNLIITTLAATLTILALTGTAQAGDVFVQTQRSGHATGTALGGQASVGDELIRCDVAPRSYPRSSHEKDMLEDAAYVDAWAEADVACGPNSKVIHDRDAYVSRTRWEATSVECVDRGGKVQTVSAEVEVFYPSYTLDFRCVAPVGPKAGPRACADPTVAGCTQRGDGQTRREPHKGAGASPSGGDTPSPSATSALAKQNAIDLCNVLTGAACVGGAINVNGSSGGWNQPTAPTHDPLLNFTGSGMGTVDRWEFGE